MDFLGVWTVKTNLRVIGYHVLTVQGASADASEDGHGFSFASFVVKCEAMVEKVVVYD